MIVNNLKEYIIEKLKINKNTSIKSNYIDSILDIIDVHDNDKVKEIIENWLGDYSKHLYCYVSKFDYKDLKDEVEKYYDDKISITPINDDLMKKAMDLANQSQVYKGKDKEKISSITLSQLDLAVYFGTFFPIIFEKTKI